jgi:pyruvate, orthophosphate dikinase
VIDEAAHRAEIGGVPLLEGDWLSIDGDTGDVFLGQIEIVTERPEAMLAEVETWREDAAKHRDRTALGVAE